MFLYLLQMHHDVDVTENSETTKRCALTLVVWTRYRHKSHLNIYESVIGQFRAWVSTLTYNLLVLRGQSFLYRQYDTPVFGADFGDCNRSV